MKTYDYILLFIFLGISSQNIKATDNYFELYRTDNGLVQDRGSNTEIYSIAASGFDMAVQSICSPKEIAIGRIHTTLNTIKLATPKRNRGWLYHFMNKQGKAVCGSEVSSIDTSIFYSGALRAAVQLKDDELMEEVTTLIQNINVRWMLENSPSKKELCHGFWYKDEQIQFIPHEWGIEYNEGIIAYQLFNLQYHPTIHNYNLPLFVYYYPMCFINDTSLRTHLDKAIAWQRKTLGYCGVTSVDTADGYCFFPVDYISPIALYTCGLEIPHGLLPAYHSYNLKTGWKSTDRIGIEEGAAILLHKK